MHIIILAGGFGMRLWPFSQENFQKKQFVKWKNLSLFQSTLKRALELKPKNILIVTNPKFSHLIKSQIKEIEVFEKCTILIEPSNRSTLIATLLGIKYLEEVMSVSKKDAILVMPSDHHIELEKKFSSLISFLEKEKNQAQNSIVTFGTPIQYPETGYGYIQVSKPITKHLFAVKQFIEKPPIEKAKIFAKDITYYWNSGIFFFSIETFLNEIQKFQKQIFTIYDQSYEKFLSFYDQLQKIPIDYAIMEKSNQLLCAVMDVKWSDIGSWDSVYRYLDKDENGNVKKGKIVDVDTKNSLIISDKTIISTIGVEDLLIVEANQSVLITKKQNSEKVKPLIEKIMQKNLASQKNKFSFHHEKQFFQTTLHTLASKETYRAIHLHDVHLIIFSENLAFLMNDQRKFLKKNESIFIPKNSSYLLVNSQDRPAVFLEVVESEKLFRRSRDDKNQKKQSVGMNNIAPSEKQTNR